MLAGFIVLPVFIASLTGLNAIMIDFIATLVIVMLIGYEGVKIAIDALQALMDHSPKEAVNEVNGIVRSIEGVTEVHDIRVRRYGEALYIEMKVHVKPKMSVEEAHKISEAIEDEIKRRLGRERVIGVLIHTEPEGSHR